MKQVMFYDFARKNEKICIVKSTSADGVFPEHKHDFFEIFYVLKGRGTHTVDNVSYDVNRGDLIFLSYNSKHTLSAKSSEFLWMNCLFNAEAINPTLINSHNSDDILRLSIFSHNIRFSKISTDNLKLVGAAEEFDRLFNNMHEEYLAAKTGYQDILTHYLLILLIKIFRVAVELEPERNSEYYKNNMVDQIINELKSAPLGSKNNLEDIARKAYVSPKYFSRLFKQETGQTLTKYIHSIKIGEACELLKTGKTVIEAMNAVGYRDSKFFYRLFLRHTGQTPGDYRKKHTNQP